MLFRHRVCSVAVADPDASHMCDRISDLFQIRGGEPGLFDPNYFMPHITVAFQTGGRDMFDSDGIYKDKQVGDGGRVEV